MEALSDFDLVNNPEFLDYLKKQNPSDEARKMIETETNRMINKYSNDINTAFKLCLKKVQSNTAFTQEGDCNLENIAPKKTSATPANGKRSIRNSSIKSGKAPATSNSKASKNKSYIRKHDINNGLSQELENKAIVSSVNREEKTLPPGTVRIQIKSNPSSTGPSPHEGEVRLVEPMSNATRLCKIGRSAAKEYSEYGVSLRKDLEVSTKHGLLTRKTSNNRYEYFFKDVGSQNGTYEVATGDRLVVDEEYKLDNGIQLMMGQSILQFNFSA